MQNLLGAGPRRALVRSAVVSFVAAFVIGAVARPLAAQGTISVPFTNGFIGARGSSAGTANNVLTYATLGIDRTFFIQNSSTNSFELQGNDIPGTLRIVRTNGTTLDMPASANWRNSGGTTYLIGILPRPASPVTFAYGNGQSIQITDGSANGGSSVGGYVAAYGGTVLVDGASTSGNAAQSQVLDGLNAYLTTVAASRPAGPVTVTALTTTSTTPTVGGSVTLAAGDALSVLVNGVQYSASTSPAVTVASGSWSLALATPLAVGTYSVTATVTNTAGYTLNDATSNELVISQATTAVTIGGTFTANDKQYDGAVAATGLTGNLSLVGVNGTDQVTIASVTLAFQSAAVGTGKTVVITAITLGGANASSYSVNLSGAPTATASITAAPSGGTVTIGGSFTANDRAYNGLTSATGNTAGLTLVGVNSPDNVSIASVTIAFQTAAAGNAKTVVITGITLGGSDASSYSVNLAGAPTATATVSAAQLTVTGIGVADRVYDGTTAAVLTGTAAYTGLATGESFAVTGSPASVFATATAGTAKAVAVTGYTAPNANYTVVQPAGLTATISPKTLAVGGAFTAANRTYDGSTSATIVSNTLTLIGIIGSESVTLTAVGCTFTNAAVGVAKQVAITGGALTGTAAANYTLSVVGAPTTTATITRRALTLGGSFTAESKEYDGSVRAAVANDAVTLVGVIAGDNVIVIGIEAAFATANAGTGRAVTLTAATLNGPAAGNYTLQLTGVPPTTASIRPRVLSIGGSFTAADKVYDATGAAMVLTNALVPIGVLGADQVTVAGVAAAFTDPAVGTDKVVAITAATLAGTTAGNYALTLAGAPTATASITAATPPLAPRNPNAIAGNGSITITWTAPADHGCRAIDSHTVEYSGNGGASWSRVTVPASPTSATVSGLVNNMAYRVRVAATNSCGTGPFADAGNPVVPIGPTVGSGGRPLSNTPGTGTSTSGGERRPVTMAVVQDTIVRVTAGALTLQLQAIDEAGAAIPADSTRGLQLERGGRSATRGAGFAPGTVVTIYLYTDRGEPLLLGTVPVNADGSFSAGLLIPATMAEGEYTLQVNGVDPALTPHSITLGVDVADAPPELSFTSTPDRAAPMVGDTITITLAIRNDGRGAATDVVIPRAFRELGFRVVRTTALEGTYDSATEQWRITRIESGAQARMRLVVVVLPPTPGDTP